ncbi:MAG TPA: PUA domain-containing protein [Nitrososphaerales archaeon]|nr:PUA domain-containing protein [Nitrososphaerales archaeon]
MKKWVLSRRDSLEMIGAVESSLGVRLELSRSAQASCEEPEGGVVFVHLGEMTFVKAAEAFFPFLGSINALSLFPSATVDAGAIRFLLNGADVMRPGIRAFDGWGDEGKTVVIREEGKGRAIAVGKSTVTSAEASKMEKGVCLKNVHHVGDRFWTLYKTV